MRKTIYFGHPVNTYGTELESELLAVIRECFPGNEIENPNQKKHQDGYKEWKEKTGNGMDYFYKKVLPACQIGIFLPFRDGKWGAGVYKEAKKMSETGCPIFRISNEGLISLVKIEDIAPLSISIEETRARVRTPAGDKVPY